MELTKEKLVIIIVNAKERLPAVIAVGTLGILLVLYFFIYAPLISQLRIAHLQCKKIEAEVLRTHEIINALKATVIKKDLITEENISLAIDELTEKSKSKGLNFTSITPKQIQKPQGNYKIMPIEMEIDATYDALGVFLGQIDDLRRSLVKVDKFTVLLDETTPSRLKTKLTLNMYIENAG